MDQHPIPQDVTGFQFKLIGSMTVKQFGYIAAGAILAVLIFYTPKIHIIAKIVLIPLLSIGGVVVAFVPIEGRPIDLMTKNFFKALVSPNQYVYKRTRRKMSFSHIADAKAAETQAAIEAAKKAAKKQKIKELRNPNKEEQLQALLMNAHATAKSSNLDSKESDFLTKVASVAAPIQKSAALSSSPLVSSGIPRQTADMSNAFLNKINPASQPPPATTTQTAQSLPSPVYAPQPASTQPALPANALVGKSLLTADEKRDSELTQKEADLEKELIAARQAEVQVSSSNAASNELEIRAAHQKVTSLEIQIQAAHQQRELLEQEIAKLKSQLTAHQEPSNTTNNPITQNLSAGRQVTQSIQNGAMQNPAAPAQPAAPTPAAPATPRQDADHVRAVPQAFSKSVGLPHVADTPNVIVGIVKDPRGNVLPNILIEVKDKDSNPVRAFKTNPLGQFASATPLAEGTYTVVLEDPKKQQTFDTIQIIANNQIMLPIEIISHDAREELRKQLFN